MAAPSVSVVMPVYNAQNFIAAAVESILDQDHTDLELIAIDDGSTDGSTDALRRLAARDRRMRVVSRENRGVVASLNEGIALARGDYIARMDADDIARRDRLSRQVRAMRERPDVALCASGFEEFRDGRITRTCIEAMSPGAAKSLSVFVTPFRHPTVMFSRALLEGELHYDARYEYAEDFDLFRRICRTHGVLVVPEPLLYYRIHEGSVTATRDQAMIANHLRIVSENLAHLGQNEDLAPLRRINAGEGGASDVEACTALFRRLDALCETLPDEAAGHYRDALREFYFLVLHLMIRRAAPMRSVGAFVEASGFANGMRRRERLAFAAARFAPALARSYWHGLRRLDADREEKNGRPLRHALA